MTTNIKEAKPIFLQEAKKSGYICPFCNNGSGADGTGITKDPKTNSYHCFKCGFHGDILDLIGVKFNLNTVSEQLVKAREIYGDIEINDYKPKDNITPPPQENYKDFYSQAIKNNDYSYLKSRGISEEIQKRFNVGFIADWVSPKAIQTTIEKGGNIDKLPKTPRCIIPRAENNYLARDTRNNLTQEEKKYQKQNQGATTLYNMQAIKDNPVVFVVEGEIDCMSVYEAGGVAIALCSTSHVKTLVSVLKSDSIENTFILMLDNDEAGQKAQKELKKELTALNITTIEANYTGKDPNSLLISNKEEFKKIITSLQDKAKQSDNLDDYNASNSLDYFLNIEKQPIGFEAKTGFSELDRNDGNLYGGLHEGLYIIGAISSLGKTTFCLQLADQIAEQGNEVIFFSLEQSKYELMSKSISRETYKKYNRHQNKNGTFKAKETMQILNNRRYSNYNANDKAIIKEGIEAYSKYAKNVYIYEGRYKGERLNVQHIKTIVKKHIEKTGKTPVIFIDYLQILAPNDSRATDKQNTDNAVFELKEISRNFHIPVFAISSFNRDNYSEAVSMTSFKESGAIEYSSDILLGLQYYGMDYRPESEKDRGQRINKLKTENEEKKANKEPINIELKCLKNRNGTLFSIVFQFVSAFNFYKENSLNDFIKQDNRKKVV